MYEERDEHGRVWRSDDEMSAEEETRDFLYGLVRLIKPNYVLETGTYLGRTATAMAAAM